MLVDNIGMHIRQGNQNKLLERNRYFWDRINIQGVPKVWEPLSNCLTKNRRSSKFGLIVSTTILPHFFNHDKRPRAL